MMFLKVILPFLFLTLLSCGSDDYWGESHSASHRYYQNEKIIFVPFDFGSLPKAIQDSTNLFLKGWLGETVYTKFKFTGGKEIDRQNMDSAAKVDSEIPDYWLHFTLYDRPNGYKDYTFVLPVSKNGHILSPPDFPNTSKYPQKAKIISLESAIEIFKESNSDLKIDHVKLEFDSTIGSVTWDILTVPIKEKALNIILDAHTGELISKTEQTYFKF